MIKYPKEVVIIEYFLRTGCTFGELAQLFKISKDKSYKLTEKAMRTMQNRIGVKTWVDLEDGVLYQYFESRA